MNKIAVFTDKKGETTTFNNEGYLKVFSKVNGKWCILRELKILPGDMTKISEVRSKITSIANEINDCSIVVGKRISGIVYNIFSSANIIVWECEGRPEGFLDYIFDEEEKKKNEKPIKDEIGAVIEDHIKKIEEGYYYISLSNIQTINERITSKQVLIPFLERGGFEKVEIMCSHIPPWIESKTTRYGLKMSIQDVCTNEIKITLAKV